MADPLDLFLPDVSTVMPPRKPKRPVTAALSAQVTDTPRPFEKLATMLGPGGEPAPTGIATRSTKAATGEAPSDPLAEAQKNDAKDAGMSSLAANLSRARDLIVGTNTGDYGAMQQKAANSHQNVEALQAKEQRDAYRSSTDLNSAVSQQATMLARAQGLIPPTASITAAQWKDIQGGAGVQAQRENAAANLELQKTIQEWQKQHATAELGQRATEGAANRNLQLTMERERMAAELERARIAAEEKQREAAAKASKEGQPKKLGDQEFIKLKNYENAVRALDELKASYDAESALGPSGGRYEDKRAQIAPTIAAADAPNARENVGLIEHTKEQLPDRWTRDSRGKAAFDAKREQLLNNYKTFVDGLRSGGFDVSGFDPGRLAAPATAGGAATTQAAGRTPVKQTPSKDGRWIRVDYSDGTSEVKSAGS